MRIPTLIPLREGEREWLDQCTPSWQLVSETIDWSIGKYVQSKSTTFYIEFTDEKHLLLYKLRWT